MLCEKYGNPKIAEVELGGNSDTVISSITFPKLSDSNNVSESEAILKLVWKLPLSNAKITGGIIPKLLGFVKTTDKKGIIVKSEEFALTLCAWIVKIFSPHVLPSFQ